MECLRAARQQPPICRRSSTWASSPTWTIRRRERENLARRDSRKSSSKPAPRGTIASTAARRSNHRHLRSSSQACTAHQVQGTTARNNHGIRNDSVDVFLCFVSFLQEVPSTVQPVARSYHLRVRPILKPSNVAQTGKKHCIGVRGFSSPLERFRVYTGQLIFGVWLRRVRLSQSAAAGDEYGAGGVISKRKGNKKEGSEAGGKEVAYCSRFLRRRHSNAIPLSIFVEPLSHRTHASMATDFPFPLGITCAPDLLHPGVHDFSPASRGRKAALDPDSAQRAHGGAHSQGANPIRTWLEAY